MKAPELCKACGGPTYRDERGVLKCRRTRITAIPMPKAEAVIRAALPRKEALRDA